MPQMAPYNWLILFLMFNIIIILLTTFNHYIIKPCPKNMSNKMIFNKYIWKW